MSLSVYPSNFASRQRLLLTKTHGHAQARPRGANLLEGDGEHERHGSRLREQPVQGPPENSVLERELPVFRDEATHGAARELYALSRQ